MFTTVRDRKSSAFDLYCHGNGRDELDVLDGYESDLRSHHYGFHCYG